MYEIFGEMDSAEEINAAAEGLKNEGDKENLYKLAEENGIDRAFADMYLDGAMEKLCCDAATAALGKIDAEAAELKPAEIIADWVEYIRTLCSDDGEFAQAVRRKGKNLKGCIGSLLGWSFRARYKVEKDIIKAAGINNVCGRQWGRHRKWQAGWRQKGGEGSTWKRRDRRHTWSRRH